MAPDPNAVPTSFVALLGVVTLVLVRLHSAVMRAVGCALAAVLLAACGGDASTATDTTADTAANKECPPVDAADLTEITVARADLLLGFSEADAERCAGELGWAYRVGMRDGEYFALTMDYSLQRVTVEVENDKVVRIAVG
jgi:hypothetical protein